LAHQSKLTFPDVICASDLTLSS